MPLTKVDSRQVNYHPIGIGTASTNMQVKLSEFVSVKDFAADPTGTTSSVAAFNAALLLGGTIFVPSGTYELDGKVSLVTNNTTLLLAANVTLNLSGVAAVQTPFGNQINVVADNCAIIGSGKSSVLQIVDSQANAIGLLHHSGFLVRDILIDGDKSNVSAIVDDTFMSGISIVCDSGQGSGFANAIIDNVEIRNFVQYGVNIFGDLARNVRITNCTIYDNGNSDELSVGAGIIATKRVFSQVYSNNNIFGNKSNGIVISSAGQTGANYVVSNNIITENSGSGILLYEDVNYGSVVDQGIVDIVIDSNICRVNARAGIEAIATVGFIKNLIVSNNLCTDNTLFGISILAQNTPVNIAYVKLSNNLTLDNGESNVAVNNYVAFAEGIVRPFTPVITGATSAGSGTYTTQTGTYLKVGQLVTFQIVIDWTAHTGTGDMLLTGLPYEATALEPVSVAWAWGSEVAVTGQLQITILSGQTYGKIGAIENGAYTPVTMDTVGSLRINGSYFTNN